MLASKLKYRKLSKERDVFKVLYAMIVLYSKPRYLEPKIQKARKGLDKGLFIFKNTDI